MSQPRVAKKETETSKPGQVACCALTLQCGDAPTHLAFIWIAAGGLLETSPREDAIRRAGQRIESRQPVGKPLCRSWPGRGPGALGSPPAHFGCDHDVPGP